MKYEFLERHRQEFIESFEIYMLKVLGGLTFSTLKKSYQAVSNLV